MVRVLLRRDGKQEKEKECIIPSMEDSSDRANDRKKSIIAWSSRRLEERGRVARDPKLTTKRWKENGIPTDVDIAKFGVAVLMRY